MDRSDFVMVSLSHIYQVYNVSIRSQTQDIKSIWFKLIEIVFGAKICMRQQHTFHISIYYIQPNTQIDCLCVNERVRLPKMIVAELSKSWDMHVD